MNSVTKNLVSVPVVIALLLVLVSGSSLAGDACESLSAIELAGPLPDLKCSNNSKELYKKSVSNAVFKAEKMRSGVDDKVAAVKSGLTEEYLQESFIELVSEDSKVSGRANIRNKTDRIFNYSLDPSSRAEQSIGAVR